MATDEQLQRLSEIADARLGVAEDFAWPIAALAFTVVMVKWDSWLFGLAAAVAGHAISIYYCRCEANKAEEVYFRQAKIGKYCE
jgi:hypothetical protein